MNPICRLDDLTEARAHRFVIDGRPVAVVRLGDTVHAIDDTCSHAKVSLSDGEVWPEACTLECPKHGSAFGLTTGTPDTLPATMPVAVHKVTVIDGDVHVEVAS